MQIDFTVIVPAEAPSSGIKCPCGNFGFNQKPLRAQRDDPGWPYRLKSTRWGEWPFVFDHLYLKISLPASVTWLVYKLYTLTGFGSIKIWLFAQSINSGLQCRGHNTHWRQQRAGVVIPDRLLFNCPNVFLSHLLLSEKKKKLISSAQYCFKSFLLFCL